MRLLFNPFFTSNLSERIEKFLPLIPLAPAMTITSVPGFLLFTMCIRDDVCFVLSAFLKVRISVSYFITNFTPARLSTRSIITGTSTDWPDFALTAGMLSSVPQAPDVENNVAVTKMIKPSFTEIRFISFTSFVIKFFYCQSSTVSPSSSFLKFVGRGTGSDRYGCVRPLQTGLYL